jgi:hypothetical protein
VSRTIIPCIELPTSGHSVTLPFPDIARPVPGGWMFTVSMRTTDPLPNEATITVMQGGATIATSTVHLSSSFQDYTVSISNDDIKKMTKGICHISGLTVIITEIPSPCCPDTEIPDTLQVSSATVGGCANCSVNPFSTLTRSGNVWIGTAENCDRQWEIRLWCDPSMGSNPPWTFRTYCSGQPANSPYFPAAGSTCSPFEMRFPGCVFGSGNNICNCLDEHGEPQNAQVSFVVTA